MLLKEQILLAALGRLQPQGLQAMLKSRQSALLWISSLLAGPPQPTIRHWESSTDDSIGFIPSVKGVIQQSKHMRYRDFYRI